MSVAHECQEAARRASGGPPGWLHACAMHGHAPCMRVRVVGRARAGGHVQHAGAQQLREAMRGEGVAALARAAHKVHRGEVGELVRR